MTFFEVLLNILAVIGIIVLGALIIYFFAVLVLSIMGKGKDGANDSSSSYGRPKVLVKSDEEDEDEVEDKGREWSEEKAEEEKKIVESPVQKQFTESSLEDERLSSLDKKRSMEDDFDNFDSIFDDDEDESDSKEEDDNDEELNKMIDDINKESIASYKEGLAKSKVKEEAVEEPAINIFEESGIEEASEEENVEEVEKTDDELVKEKAELEKQRAELEEQRKALEEERQKMEQYKQEIENIERQVQGGTNSMYGSWTMDQLNERLEVLKARLKANEKELKANRKEYNPLARVKRVLDKDKEKLRRREAIVARKKVILYGVNNYVDIDEEKAKKLSEDLDLLDGLRLSVQHCEDVMNSNKDRFPILEKTNRILVETNQNIKDDIAEVETAIATRKVED